MKIGPPKAIEQPTQKVAVFGVLQMPPGVPVAGVAVGGWGARNAAYLAAAILSLKHDDIKKNYTEFRTKQAEG